MSRCTVNKTLNLSDVTIIMHVSPERRDVPSDIISIGHYTLCNVMTVFGAGYERSHLDAVKAFPPQVVLQMPSNMKSVLYIMLSYKQIDYCTETNYFVSGFSW